MLKKHFNKKGAVLPLVLIVFIALLILGYAFMSLSLSDTKTAVYFQNKSQANLTARSGINVGQELLETEVFNANHSNLGSLVSALEASSTGDNYIVSDIGYFNLDFSTDAPDVRNGKVKITAIGKNVGSSITSTDKVTFTMYVRLPIDETLTAYNPSEWMSANGKALTNPNSQKVAKHDVISITNYIGKFVTLSGGVKPIKYPQGGTNASHYQASIINIQAANNGISITQDSNNLDMYLDSEVILFGGEAEKKFAKDIILEVSDPVLQRTNPGYLKYFDPTNENYNLGFEKVGRYVDFITSNISSYNNPSGISILTAYHESNYQASFLPGVKYGIYCYYQGDTITNAYFFPNRMSMFYFSTSDSPNSLYGNNDKITIKDNDPILTSLERLINDTGEVRLMYWDNE